MDDEVEGNDRISVLGTISPTSAPQSWIFAAPSTESGKVGFFRVLDPKTLLLLLLSHAVFPEDPSLSWFHTDEDEHFLGATGSKGLNTSLGPFAIGVAVEVKILLFPIPRKIHAVHEII